MSREVKSQLSKSPPKSKAKCAAHDNNLGMKKRYLQFPLKVEKEKGENHIGHCFHKCEHIYQQAENTWLQSS